MGWARERRKDSILNGDSYLRHLATLLRKCGVLVLKIVSVSPTGSVQIVILDKALVHGLVDVDVK